MGALVAFGRFWWRFVVGDDPRIAAGLVLVIAAAAVAAAAGARGAIVAVAVGVAVIALTFASIVRDAGRRPRG